jgi:hypothetical protein
VRIGKPMKPIILEPLPEPARREEPAPTKTPEPAESPKRRRRREKVPA